MEQRPRTTFLHFCIYEKDCAIVIEFLLSRTHNVTSSCSPWISLVAVASAPGVRVWPQAAVSHQGQVVVRSMSQPAWLGTDFHENAMADLIHFICQVASLPAAGEPSRSKPAFHYVKRLRALGHIEHAFRSPP